MCFQAIEMLIHTAEINSLILPRVHYIFITKDQDKFFIVENGFRAKNHIRLFAAAADYNMLLLTSFG
jgi:hypothetical protein